MTLVDDDTNSIIADTVNPNNAWIDREMHNVDEEITKGLGRQGGVLWSFKDGDHRTSSLTILGTLYLSASPSLQSVREGCTKNSREKWT